MDIPILTNQKKIPVGSKVVWNAFAIQVYAEKTNQFKKQIGDKSFYTVTKLIDMETEQDATETTQYFAVSVDDHDCVMGTMMFDLVEQ